MSPGRQLAAVAGIAVVLAAVAVVAVIVVAHLLTAGIDGGVAWYAGYWCRVGVMVQGSC